VDREERDAAAANRTGGGSAFARAFCTLDLIADSILNDT